MASDPGDPARLPGSILRKSKTGPAETPTCTRGANNRGAFPNAISYCTAKMNDLLSFLRIPSISALPEHAAEVRRAAEFVRDWLARAGLQNSRLIEGQGYPLVFSEWTGAKDKPTLLLYGHYDVQPPDPLDEWISPPFEPAIRDGNIYARGAADDKGQLFILMEAAAQIIACLKDRDGHILVPGVYDRVEKAGAAEIAAWNSLPFDAEEFRQKEIGSIALAGQPEIPLFERMWARQTL